MVISASPAELDTAWDEVVSYFDAPDPFDYDAQEMEPLQLRAIRELFGRRRQQIQILDQRAKAIGANEIGEFKDLVPLLFADQTYKSYPETFVKNNQWGMMCRWLDTLSTNRIGPIDVSDVGDSDAWIARLAEHGHHLVVSGGTSGKNSFLNRTAVDVRRACESVVANVALTQGISPDAKDRPVILLGPSSGTYIMVALMRALAEAFARPGEAYWLSEIPMTEAETQRQAELRRKVKDGTASPGELRELKERAETRQEEMRKSIETLTDVLVEHRGEPIMLIGLWLPLFLLMEEAQRRGIGDGVLHPDSTVFSGGGLKGANLPANYKEQLDRFFGVDPSRYYVPYGMVEMLTGFIQCSESRYHAPPWVKMLILDQEGENLLEPVNGRVEGRFAFVDLLVEGRWGGVITGDKVSADFTPCGCGRRSPGVTRIERYADLAEGDDKLSCAGTMASYIRGEIE